MVIDCCSTDWLLFLGLELGTDFLRINCLVRRGFGGNGILKNGESKSIGDTSWIADGGSVSGTEILDNMYFKGEKIHIYHIILYIFDAKLVNIFLANRKFCL